MKPLQESRIIWVSVGQVILSALAATLTPGVDCAPWVTKVLAALAAGAGVAVIALRTQDKYRDTDYTDTVGNLADKGKKE